MITAHSGCEGTADNSIAHIECALRCGAEALEIDVHPGTDGQFYLSHDPSADQSACPPLSKAFSMIRGSSIKINCDLKAPGIEARVLEMAEAWGVGEQVILSGCVSREALRDPKICRRTFWNIEEAVPEIAGRYQHDIPPAPDEVETALAACKEAGVSVINVYYELCTPQMLEASRRAGIQVSAWTVNDAGWITALLNAGVRNITTRKPVLAVGLRKNRG